ncbi:MAG: hypothetical protein MIO93_10905, partial [ANME-2 cluster archaeon]|nr:hypothetical protein [ANME-2 cluster archaeon]
MEGRYMLLWMNTQSLFTTLLNDVQMSSVKREKWDGTRIGTDNIISVGIRQMSVICVLFQLRINNHNYLSHFEKRHALNQLKSLTDDQWQKRLTAEDAEDRRGLLFFSASLCVL